MESIWVVCDINGELYKKHGHFPTQRACYDYIRKNIDSPEDRNYDRDSMFTPVEVKPHVDAATS